MNQLLERDVHEALDPRTAGQCRGLGCEPALRVAAATLSRTRTRDISATTVVGVLGLDDRAAVEALVADIAQEFGLESQMRAKVGSFTVRFSRIGDH
jgi:hypothetical protein